MCSDILAFVLGDNIEVDAMNHVITYLKFASRTGRSWMEIKNNTNARLVWEKALDVCNQLPKVQELNAFQDIMMIKFSLFCWLADLSSAMESVAQNYLELASQILKEGNGILGNDDISLMNHEVGIKYYNISVSRFKEKKYDQAYLLLDKSIQFLDASQVCDKKIYSKVLRTRVHCLILRLEGSQGRIPLQNSRKELEVSLKVIQKANALDKTVPGIVILTKLFWMLGMYDEGSALYTDALANNDFDIDVKISFVSIAIRYGRKELAMNGYDQLKSFYRLSPSIGVLYCVMLEYLLNNVKNYHKSRIELADIIEDHKKAQHLKMNVLKQLHYMSWQTSVGFYENKDFDSALDWFQRTYDIFMLFHGNKDDKAQVLRMISVCSLKKNQKEKALEYARLSYNINRKSLPTCTLLFEIYLAFDDNDKMRELIIEISAIEKSNTLDTASVLEYLSRKALEHKNDQTAEFILYKLLQNPSTPSNKVPPILINTIKLVSYQLTEQADVIDKYKTLLDFLELGSGFIKRHGLIEIYKDKTTSKIIQEVSWLYGVAWNAGVKANKEGVSDLTHLFFSEAYKYAKSLHKVYPSEDTWVSIQDAVLAYSGSFLMNANKDSYCLGMLTKVEKRLVKLKDVKASTAFKYSNPDSEEKIDLLIIQCMILKRSPDVMSYILKVKEHLGPESMESIATSASKYTHISNTVESETLKFALELHSKKLSQGLSLEEQEAVICRCLVIFRKLISTFTLKDDAFQTFQVALRFVEMHSTTIRKDGKWQQSFENEIHWFAVESFNNGIYYWKLSKLSTAEKWAKMATTWTPHLRNKYDLESKLNEAYVEIVAKLKESEQMED